MSYKDELIAQLQTERDEARKELTLEFERHNRTTKERDNAICDADHLSKLIIQEREYYKKLAEDLKRAMIERDEARKAFKK